MSAYASVGLCLSHLSTAAAACGGFAAVGPAGLAIAATGNDTQQHGSRQQMLLQQCHVVS